MNTIPKLFKKHPIAIGFYLLYALLWLRIIIVHIGIVQYYKIAVHTERPMHDEGFAFASLAALIISVIFAIVICANAVVRSKDQTPFYLWMVAAIIIPVIIIGLSVSG